MSAPPTLETARLRLRAWTAVDVDRIVAMDFDPAVRRFLPPAPPDQEAHRLRLLDRLPDGGPPGGRTWIVEWRDRPGALGWCGLFPLDNSDEIEIGYRYATAAWGQGVATEAARAVLAHGFDVMGLARVLAVTDPENRASQRVLAKIGLGPRGTGFHYGRELPLFGIERTVTRVSR